MLQPPLESAVLVASWGPVGGNPEALHTWVRAEEQGGRNERGEVSDQEAHIRAWTLRAVNCAEPMRS